jgi:hypothetical protein
MTKVNPYYGLTKEQRTGRAKREAKTQAMKDIHLGDILKEKLNFSEPSKLYARIYSSYDGIEWNQTTRQAMHNGKTYVEALKHVKDSLESLGIPRIQIPTTYRNIRNEKGDLHYPDFSLGRYEYAELCIAVRLNDLFNATPDGKTSIKFFAIDPFAEDIYRYNGSKITEAELTATPSSRERQMTPESAKTVSYSEIPEIIKCQYGISYGWRYQQGITLRRMQKEEGEAYMNFFGQTSLHAISKGCTLRYEEIYDSVPFYPIP